MVFAIQKLRERHGEDTIFSVRGQTRTRGEIERYWKRRRLNPAAFSPIASTPDGLEYHAPGPSLTQDCDGHQVPETWSDDFELFHGTFWGTDPFREAAEHLLLTPPSRTLRIFHASTSLQIHEEALRSAVVYLRTSTDFTRLDSNFESLKQVVRDINQFRATAYNALSAMIYNTSQYSVKAAQLDTLLLLSKVLRHERPILMAEVLDVVTECLLVEQQAGIVTGKGVTVSGSHSEVSQIPTKLFSREIMDIIAKAHYESHPLVCVLRAVCQVGGCKTALPQELMRVGIDIMVDNVGYEHPETQIMSRAASDIFQHSENWHAALKYAERQYSKDLAKARICMTSEILKGLLGSIEQVIQCHIELKNFEEAQKLVEEGLQNCCYLEAQQRDDWRSIFLLQQGVMKWRCGQLAAAEEDLTQALTLRLPLFGAGEACVVQIAAWLKRVLQEQRKRQSGYSAEASSDDQDHEHFSAIEQEGFIVSAEGHEIIDEEAVVDNKTVVDTEVRRNLKRFCNR